MATDRKTVEIILELLGELPLASRAMFGEYALSLSGKIVAFVTDDVFSLKVTELSDPRLTPALLGEAYPGSKLYWRIPTDLLEDREWAQDLVFRTAQALPEPKPKRPKPARGDG